MKSGAISWKLSASKVRVANAASWALALSAFTLAILVSNRAVEDIPNDLRRTPILLLNALAAALVAFGFAAHEGSLKHWTNVQYCLRFGVWTAAIFRLLPSVMNEDVLYLKNCGTFDAPYVVLGACVHGGLALLLASPYAMRVVAHSVWTDEARVFEMCGTVILVFFVMASAVRLLSEHWW